MLWLVYENGSKDNRDTLVFVAQWIAAQAMERIHPGFGSVSSKASQQRQEIIRIQVVIVGAHALDSGAFRGVIRWACTMPRDAAAHLVLGERASGEKSSI